MEAERRLDLRRLDPEAPQLDLMVDAAQKLEASVGQAAHQIARAIEAIAGLRSKRIRDEQLAGQLRASQVSPGEAGATQKQLSRHSGRRGTQPAVQNVGAHVWQRPADGEVGPSQGVGTRAVGDEHRGGDRRLGGAVGGKKGGLSIGCQPRPGAKAGRRHALAAGQEDTQGRRQRQAARRHLLHPLAPEGGRQVEDGHSEAFTEAQHLDAGEVPRPRMDDQRAAAHERREDLQYRGVERQRSEEQQAVFLADVDRGGKAAHEVRHRAVRSDHSLRDAGRA